MIDELAAISGKLVDARNVGTHKSMKLTVHIPEEQAMEFLNKFGWPTMVNPIEVAVAKINPNAAAEPPEDGGAVIPTKRSVPVNHRLSQQAAMACQDKLFWRYLGAMNDTGPMRSEDEAANLVRFHLGVISRAEFDTDQDAADRWSRLYSDFILWSRHPELGGA